MEKYVDLLHKIGLNSPGLATPQSQCEATQNSLEVPSDFKLFTIVKAGNVSYGADSSGLSPEIYNKVGSLN